MKLARLDADSHSMLFSLVKNTARSWTWEYFCSFQPMSLSMDVCDVFQPFLPLIHILRNPSLESQRLFQSSGTSPHSIAIALP